jgi:hypothetical protein
LNVCGSCNQQFLLADPKTADSSFLLLLCFGTICTLLVTNADNQWQRSLIYQPAEFSNRAFQASNNDRLTRFQPQHSGLLIEDRAIPTILFSKKSLSPMLCNNHYYPAFPP